MPDIWQEAGRRRQRKESVAACQSSSIHSLLDASAFTPLKTLQPISYEGVTTSTCDLGGGATDWYVILNISRCEADCHSRCTKSFGSTSSLWNAGELSEDLPNAMNAAEITDKLGLHSLRQRHWYIQSTCATSPHARNEDLMPATTWTVECSNNNVWSAAVETNFIHATHMQSL